jgi:inorganic pyrophosphatase
MKNGPVRVYIEIEKGSNMKYEFCKETEELVLDRILPDQYRYPFAYGYILDTKAADGDELDILIITDKYVKKDRYYNAYIVGVLIMEDEKGMDEKVLCVFEEDRERIKDISDIASDELQSIHWFFTNYKSETPGKWSQVHNFQNKESAIKLYNKHKLNNIIYLNSRE